LGKEREVTTSERRMASLGRPRTAKAREGKERAVRRARKRVGSEVGGEGILVRRMFGWLLS